MASLQSGNTNSGAALTSTPQKNREIQECEKFLSLCPNLKRCTLRDSEWSKSALGVHKDSASNFSNLISYIQSHFQNLDLQIKPEGDNLSSDQLQLVTAKSNKDFLGLIGSMEVILDTFNQFCGRTNHHFSQLENYILSCFAEIWWYMIQNCNLPRKMLPGLPVRSVEIYLIRILQINWPLQKINQIRYKFSNLRLHFLKDIDIYSNESEKWKGVEAAWEKFEKETPSLLSAGCDDGSAISEYLKTLESFKQVFVKNRKTVEDFCSNETPASVITPKKSKNKMDVSPELYSPIQMRQDIISIQRILNYIRTSINCYHDQNCGNLVKRLVIERALQVTGECVKGSKGSPNLSSETRNILIRANIHLEKLESLRNLFSHTTGLLVSKRRIAEQKLDTLIKVDELEKLKRVFERRLNRVEFILLRENVVEYMSEGNNNIELYKCQTFEKLMEFISEVQAQSRIQGQCNMECPGRKVNNLTPLINQISVRACLDKIEANIEQLSRGENLNLIDNMFLFDNKGVQFKPGEHFTGREGRSIVSEVSTQKGLIALQTEMALTSNLHSKENSVPSENLFDRFLQVAIGEFFDIKVYQNLSNSLGLGVELDLSIDSFLNPDYRSVRENLTDEAKSDLHITLQLLNQVVRNRKADEMDAILELAMREFIPLEEVKQRCSTIGIQDTSLVNKLYYILYDLPEFKGSDHMIDLALDQVVNESKNLDPAVYLDITTSKNYIRSKLNLVAIVEEALGNCGGASEPKKESEFEKLSKLVFENPKLLKRISANAKQSILEKMCGHKYATTSFKQCTIFVKTIKGEILFKDPLEFLIKDLKDKRSYSDSCKAFKTYIATLDISEGEKSSVTAIFESQERKRLEDFMKSRISQLEQILFICGVLTRESEEFPIRPLEAELAYEKFSSNESGRAAVEMALLDCIEILESLEERANGMNPIVKKLLGYLMNTGENETPLRNYLAHGDPTLEVLSQNTCRLLLNTAIKLVIDGNGAIALIKLLKTDSILHWFGACTNEIGGHGLVKVSASELGNPDQKEWLKEFQLSPNWEKILNRLFQIDPKEATNPRLNDENYSSQLDLLAHEVLEAIVNDKVPKLKMLLSSRSNCEILNFKFEHNWTILHHCVATRTPNIEIIEILLENGSDPNARTDTDVTVLHLGVLSGKVEVVKLLVSNGAVEFSNSDGVTSVHIAAQQGFHDILSVLIQSGNADINVQSKAQWSALHFAINYHHSETISRMLEQRSLFLNSCGPNELTPLHLAIIRGSGDAILGTLLASGADRHAHLRDTVNGRTLSSLHLAAAFGNVNCIQYIVDKFSSSISWNSLKRTNDSGILAPIYVAAKFGWKNVERELKILGLPVFEPSGTGLTHTPLRTAMTDQEERTIRSLKRRRQQLHQCELDQTIISSVPMDKFLVKDIEGESDWIVRPASNLLECASSERISEDFQQILKSCSPNKKELNELMFWACRENVLPVASYLIEQNSVNFDIKDDELMGPLQVASRYGSLSVVQHFVQYCAQDRYGTDRKDPMRRIAIGTLHEFLDPPFLIAVNHGQWRVVEYLLKDVGNDSTSGFVKDYYGSNILKKVAEAGRWSLVHKLIEKGWGSSNMQDIFGVAALAGHFQTLEHLFGKGPDNINYWINNPFCEIPSGFLEDFPKICNGTMLRYLKAKGLSLPNIKLGLYQEIELFCLHSAARHGNLSACEFFLKDEHIKVDDQTPPNKQTPLHAAVDGKSLIAIEYLIDKGANLSLTDSQERTPFEFAIQKKDGNPGIIRILFEKSGGDVNQKDEAGNTLLHLYFREKTKDSVSVELAEYFFAKGHMVNCKDQMGNTLLHLLVSGSNLFVMSELMDNLKILVNVANNVGETPLILATKLATKVTLNSFFKSKDTRDWTDLTYTNTEIRMVELLVMNRSNVNMQNYYAEETALHWAVRENMEVIGNIILSAKPQPNPIIANIEGETVKSLSQKAFKKMEELGLAHLCERFYKKLMDYCLKWDAAMGKDFSDKPEIDPKVPRMQIDSRTAAIDNAIFKQDSQFLSTALLSTIFEKDWETTSYLLNSLTQSEVPLPEITGSEPKLFCELAESGQLDLMKLLIEKCSGEMDLNVGVEELGTPLICAARGGHFETLKYLLKDKRVNPNSRSKHQAETALHLAAASGYAGIVQMLLENGASNSLLDLEGRTPFEMAGGAGQRHVIQIFLNKFPYLKINPEVLRKNLEEYVRAKDKWRRRPKFVMKS